MGPVLASIIPGRPAHPRVLELKPWARRTITLWVLIVVPYLAYWLIGFLLIIPKVLPVVWDRLVYLSHAVAAKAAEGNIAETTLGIVQIVLLLIPWVGSLLMLGLVLRRPVRWLLTRSPLARLRVRRA
jgi:putative peptide zinc metalloprotease protein